MAQMFGQKRNSKFFQQYYFEQAEFNKFGFYFTTMTYTLFIDQDACNRLSNLIMGRNITQEAVQYLYDSNLVINFPNGFDESYLVNMKKGPSKLIGVAKVDDGIVSSHFYCFNSFEYDNFNISEWVKKASDYPPSFLPNILFAIPDNFMPTVFEIEINRVENNFNKIN